MTTISVGEMGASECVDVEGAIDAHVTVDGRAYEVTLIPSDYDGRLSTWGSRENWIAGEGWNDLSTDTCEEIEAAVREAAESRRIEGRRRWQTGDRVEGGNTPEDYDTGSVFYRDGALWVAWDQGTETRVEPDELRPEGERPIEASA